MIKPACLCTQSYSQRQARVSVLLLRVKPLADQILVLALYRFKVGPDRPLRHIVRLCVRHCQLVLPIVVLLLVAGRVLGE